jgi:hypothetical protein
MDARVKPAHDGPCADVAARSKDIAMNLYWTTVLLALAVAMLAGEAFALRSGRTTFSRYVWTASRAWPPLPLVADLATQAASGAWDGNRLIADLTALGSGLGLIFAKDGNVTGGSVKQ